MTKSGADPHDIEWAFQAHTLHLLQRRPITTSLIGRVQTDLQAVAGGAPASSRRPPMMFAIGFGSPLVVFVLASVVFWLIDVRRDHCLGVSG